MKNVSVFHVCVCAHVGHIPTDVSCAGWPAVTFLACVVTVTPAGTSCPEFHWPAINSLPVSVRKWQGWPWNRLTLSYTHAHTHHYLLIHITTCQILCEGVFPFLLTLKLITIKSIWVPLAINIIYFHLLWPPETGQHSTWIKLLQLSKRCCLPSTECSFTVDTEIAVNSSHSGTDGTSITVKVSPTANTLSAFAELCPYLSASFQTVHENWSVFTVANCIEGLSLKNVIGMLYSA